MRHWLQAVQDSLITWGPLGMLVLAIVESAGIPNPGGTDFLLVILAVSRPDEAMTYAAAVIVGSLIGSMIFLEITRKGGEKFLTKYTSSGRGARFRNWFQRYGLVTVFISALLPIPFLPLKAFSACAGATGISRTRYFLIMVAGRVPRYLGLAYLGTQLGEKSWPWLLGHRWEMLALGTCLFLALYGMIRWADRSRRPATAVE